jgi:hypothetical protein
MLIIRILLAVCDMSVPPYTWCVVMKETVVKNGRGFCFSQIYIYVCIDWTPSLEMQLGGVSLFLRLLLL